MSTTDCAPAPADRPSLRSPTPPATSARTAALRPRGADRRARRAGRGATRRRQQRPGLPAELDRLLTDVRRPPDAAHRARSAAAEHAGGSARILLKREDLAHTGAHKINNVLGQALLAKRMGKPRVIAETGAGQHGVATATACALLGLECVVYMGEEDTRRQALNVARMRLLGAEVVPVTTGSRDAQGRDQRGDARLGDQRRHHALRASASVVGPHPFPMMVRDFQRVIGVEAREQILELIGRLPDAVVACVGGGSNAIGHLPRRSSTTPACGWSAVEAGGDGVDDRPARRDARRRRPGVLHGTRTYLLQDDGRPDARHPLDLAPGSTTRASAPSTRGCATAAAREYAAVDDARRDGRRSRLLARTEGILPAIETRARDRRRRRARRASSGRRP